MQEGQAMLPGAPKIYAAIAGVINDIGVVSKDKVNKQQGFKYRSVDDVYSVLNPALAKNKVFILPEILDETREIGTSKSGGRVTSVILKMKYTVYAEDGSHVETVLKGEAMDTGDFGLVNVVLDIEGEKYILNDIFLRMLKPEELKLMQGFPKDYIIDRDYRWKSYPITKQVARIGNSVVPIMAQKLVEANCPYLKVGERLPNFRTEEEGSGQIRFA